MSYEDKKEETLQISLKSLFKYPLRGSTALLAVDSRVLVCLHPPNLPGREAFLGFSPRVQKKEKNSRSSLLYPLRGSNPGPQH